MSLEVARHERGLIRVFALSMEASEARKLRAKDDDSAADSAKRLAESLGLSAIDADFTEVFPISDLDELGLDGYLVEGNGVTEDQIAPDRSKLAALDGWVMVVYSRAFAGQEMVLRPKPALTLIGTYREPGVDWTEDRALESAAATEPAELPKRPSDAAMMGRVATVVLVLLFALTALMVWIAG